MTADDLKSGVELLGASTFDFPTLNRRLEFILTRTIAKLDNSHNRRAKTKDFFREKPFDAMIERCARKG